MSVNLSIKGVPDDLAERLRQQAERNHRSLQGELMAIIEQAAAQGAAAPVGAPRTISQGWKTIEDLVAERAARNTQAVQGGPLAVDIIRADRDAR